MQILDFDCKTQLSERYTQESLQRGEIDDNGYLFISSAGVVEQHANFLASTVDTVRQLYTGTPVSAIIEKIEQCIADKDFFSYSHIDSFFVNHQWHVSKMSKVSGYRYKLQNNELGLVVLFGSYYAELEKQGSHLKIECSPHFLLNQPPTFIQQRLDILASLFLSDYKYSGVAIHLAADLQGWRPQANFMDSFVTRSRFQRFHDGLSEMVLDDDFSGVSTRYGSGSVQTYTYGKVASLQSCIYNKSAQIISVDKVDYYHTLWGSSCLEFDNSLDVWRCEFRFHHSVVREIGNALDCTFESYEAVYPYLADLWRYALKRNRLELVKGVLDPVWQIMLESFDVVESKGVNVFRSKKQDQSALCKNYSLIIGNMITVMARCGAGLSDVMTQFKRLTFYDDILSSYRSRGLTESDLRQQVEKGLALRRLIGKAA